MVLSPRLSQSSGGNQDERERTGVRLDSSNPRSVVAPLRSPRQRPGVRAAPGGNLPSLSVRFTEVAGRVRG